MNPLKNPKTSIERTKKYGYIYKITNIVTSQSYIGLTLRKVSERWASHRYSASATSPTNSLSEAIFRYGPERFKVVTLGRYPIQKLPFIEKKQIIRHKTLAPHGYNRHPGGAMSDGFGNQTRVGKRKFKSLSAAERHLKLAPGIAKQRIANGWSTKEALGLTEKANIFKPIELRVGRIKFRSVQAAAKAYKLNTATVFNRLRSGWNSKQALGLSAPPKRKMQNGKPILIAGKNFLSIQEAARYFRLNAKRVRGRLSSGWTPEEALGIISRNPKHFQSVSVDGNDFRNLKAAAKHFGVQYNTARRRLKKGWTLQQALGVETAPQIIKNHFRPVTVGSDKFVSITDAALHFGVSSSLTIKRLALGWSIEEALNLEMRKNPNSKSVIAFGKSYPSLKTALKDLPTSYPTVMKLVNQGYSLDKAVELAVASRSIEHNGVLYPSRAHLARAFKVHPCTLIRRLTNGWSTAEAVGERPRFKTLLPGAKPVHIKGFKFRSISEAARSFGIEPATVLTRLKNGWTLKRALTTPKNATRHNAIEIVIRRKKFDSIASAARHFKIPVQVVRNRISNGWTITKSCTTPKMKKGGYRR